MVIFIKMSNNFTRKIPVSIPESDNLGPMLFNVIMDEISEEVKGAGRGYRMGTEKRKCYADDAVMISEDGDKDSQLDFNWQRKDVTHLLKKSSHSPRKRGAANWRYTKAKLRPSHGY